MVLTKDWAFSHCLPKVFQPAHPAGVLLGSVSFLAIYFPAVVSAAHFPATCPKAFNSEIEEEIGFLLREASPTSVVSVLLLFSSCFLSKPLSFLKAVGSVLAFLI